jgi:ABC-2 type transport system ATP-binding protein
LLASGTAQDVHSMMVDVPNEITIRCSDPHVLAAMLVERRAADSLRISGDAVTVATQHPALLYDGLPAWLAESKLDVFAMDSAYISLQGLFSSLMKMHRGEL